MVSAIDLEAAANTHTVIRVGAVIDGLGGPPIRDAMLLIDGERIESVGPTALIEPGLPESTDLLRLDFPTGYLLPGLIDTHTHVMFGERGRTYEEVVAEDSDELMLLRATKNVMTHLRAGVTTMRDNGARNRVSFDLREGARRGYVYAPRLLLSGRPITMTRGHFYFCGQEADGVHAVRKAVHQLVEEGADHIKIMASGGGTAITDATRPSYSVGELRAIVEEAHRLGRRTTAHCVATKSIENVLDAGVDMIEHATFLAPDRSVQFDHAIAERMADLGTVVSPTIGTDGRALEDMAEMIDAGRIGPDETWKGFTHDGLKALVERRMDTLRRLWLDYRIPIVSGTDAVDRFGDYCRGLEVMVQAGMSTGDVIRASTSIAADALGVGNLVGSIERGKQADLIVVDRDPLTDITALRETRLVVLGGKVVHQDRTTDPPKAA